MAEQLRYIYLGILQIWMINHKKLHHFKQVQEHVIKPTDKLHRVDIAVCAVKANSLSLKNLHYSKESRVVIFVYILY